jgi:hypothetical protein
MRVRVYETGHENAMAGIQRRFVWIGVLEFTSCANCDNFFVAYNDGAVFNDAKCAKGMSTLGSAGKREELRG